MTYVTAGYSPAPARLADNWEERRIVICRHTLQRFAPLRDALVVGG